MIILVQNLCRLRDTAHTESGEVSRKSLYCQAFLTMRKILHRFELGYSAMYSLNQ
jgi:hypothetical protein